MSREGSIKETILSATDLQALFQDVATAIFDSIGKDKNPIFVGIENRGVPFASRVASLLSRKIKDIETGSLDISLYRDDRDNLGTIPSLKGTNLPHDLDGRHVILFDDVLFTGRTVRAAIDALMDFGRPASIELAVLVDRGNRELPIAANYCGKEIITTKDDYISVMLKETDKKDGVFLLD